MSIDLIATAVDALGDLAAEVTFVGAAAMPLWITQSPLTAMRVTADADVVVGVATKAAYDRFATRLGERGLAEDTESRVIGRWRITGSALRLDVIPSDPSILGFESRWLRMVPSTARSHVLPSGRGDYFASKDFEDIVAMVDGREELPADLASAELTLRAFVGEWFGARLDDPQFLAGIEGAL